MRINELNMFQNLLQKGATLAKDIAGSLPKGQAGFGGKEDQLAKKMFTDKFVSRAKDALNTAVQQGLVDPQAPLANKQATQPGQKQANQTTTNKQATQPGQKQAKQTTTNKQATQTTTNKQATQPGQKQAKQTTTTQPGGKPQIDVDTDAAVKAMRTFQPTGNRPLTGKFADELNKDIQYVSKNKDYLLRAANKIQKFNGAGYDVKQFHQNFMNQYALGKKQQTIQESRLREIYNRLTTQQTFKNALRKSGYDPDIAAKRIETLLAKHEKDREERYEKERKMGLDEGFPPRKSAATKPKKVATSTAATSVVPQGGGKVAGQLSQTPNAIRKRQARAAAKTGTGTATQAATTSTTPAAGGGMAVAPGINPVTGKPFAAKASGTAAKSSTTTATQPASSQAASSGSGLPSMGDWLKDNFIDSFFKGVPWNKAQSQIDAILEKMSKNYPKIDNDLKAIAEIGWALSPKAYDAARIR